MYARHTLLDISRTGRERIVDELVAKGWDRAACEDVLLSGVGHDAGTGRNGGTSGKDGDKAGGIRPVPGIVRREDYAPRQGMIPVGFVSWTCGSQGRLRLASFVTEGEVVSVTSPSEVLARTMEARTLLVRTPALRALNRLAEKQDETGSLLGVWGSAALELYTGMQYTHDGSDLDLWMRPFRGVRQEELARALRCILETEQEFGIRIDAEVDLPNGYGVSLKELLGKGHTVMGKGSLDVTLLQKEDVFTGLA